MGSKFKGWIGIALVAWPAIRMIALGFGLPLPDLDLNGLADVLGGLSSAAGGSMLAATDPIVGKKAQ